MSSQLKPCPFCGKVEAVRITRSSETPDFDDSNPDSFAIVCDASSCAGISPVGCGAQSGFAGDAATAVLIWNGRSFVEPLQAPPEVAALQARIAELEAQLSGNSGELEGWKLVPTEPTGIMKDIGASSLPVVHSHTRIAAVVYRAMIAAAPATRNQS